MSRGRVAGLLLTLSAAFGITHVGAAGPAIESSRPVLEQFLTLENASPQQYRALRHLEARTLRFSSSAWMDVWTEADVTGFRYRIVREGGSESIRKKVFRSLLELERKSWAPGELNPAGVTPRNYSFDDVIAPADTDGLAKLGVKALRKDVLLINGSIFLKPENGDMVRMEGRLAKTPSFWTRRVDVVKRYERLNGVRLPVALESVAEIVIYGRATFSMTYDYESINDRRVGNPQLREVGATAQ